MSQDAPSDQGYSTEALENLWAFLRGDLDGVTFEEWVYTWDAAEAALGQDIYLDILSTNFQILGADADLKAALRQTLPRPHACACCTVPNGGSVGMGTWTQEFFTLTEDALDGCAWRRMMLCSECGTTWLVVEEDRIYDEWILERAGGPGLPETKTYRGLLKAAKGSGAQVHFHEPENSVMLRLAIEDLAKETPGIALSEVCDLLPISPEVATVLAETAMRESEISINLSA